MAATWLQCYKSYAIEDGAFAPAESGAEWLVAVSKIVAMTQVVDGVTLVMVQQAAPGYLMEFYVSHAPFEVVRRIAGTPDGGIA